ncbi:TPR-like protein [Rhizopogon vinicolor AM-OR11-026]|uniref:TPR-like protein n=1 Tax=Rhizopogon vinicolor AM-OR11-026 TaxID=1314800 RepID=A0A1B7MUN9_9AGAM|nr:TPR-like protein [Rhizopogon vinicolor AM-OR11-026]
MGVLSHLDEAIDLYRAALSVCPHGHSYRSQCLNNLAVTLHERFDQRGLLSNLEEAIDHHRTALALRPPGHAGRASSLSNLALAVQARFKQRGVLCDLDEAIDLHHAALALCPPGDSDRSSSLNNLANSLRDRFNQRGVLSDLDVAIDLHRAALAQSALALRPPGHSYRPSSLNNLAISLQDRFKQRGVLSDLDEAIDLHRAALALCPPGHSDRSLAVNNLANSLQDRFGQRGVLSDLDEGIDLHRAALALPALSLCPPDHLYRFSSLDNLAMSLQDRFKQRRVLSDLDEAIDLHQAALALCPPGHSGRSFALNNLANSLQDRFEQRGVISDLDEAIDLHQAALALRPPGSSQRSESLNNLAMSLQDRFTQRGILSDLNQAFSHYSQLSQASHAVSHIDLRAAKSWTTAAEQLNHSSVLTAYHTALMFLDHWQHLAGLSSSSHHFNLVREATSSMAMDAFSCGVRHHALMTAVELVEQGRAVFWTQLSRFHAPADQISASGHMGEALVVEFKELSFHLRSVLESSTEDTAQIRKLTVQRDDVISRIRMLPGFSRFLLPPLFSDLQKAAQDGPVIIVNASQYSCDALIILSAQDPVHLGLDIARAEVSEWSTELQSITKDAGSSDDYLERNTIVRILRELWRHIVAPIVKALTALIRPGSRIWWCPTAEFMLLPLHAAGSYIKNGDNLSHFYISSYTPTLATLIRARHQVPRDASTPHFVAIGQGHPGTGKELPRVAVELRDVAQRVAPILPFTSLADSDATVKHARDAISRHQWLHLACHGLPDQEKPFDSSFAMYDGPLTITEIIRLQRPHSPNPEFAFLSACHTTVGHASSPDEAVHLAAAMQFSGFRSVIGSMWSVDDKVVGQIVSAFYENMIDKSGRLDCTRAAVALHKAVKKLRKQIPIEQLIVFIHIGV